MGENNDKEINVREVFAAIGSFFAGIFKGIGSVFLYLFFFLIKNRILIGIFGIIGIIAGGIYSNTGRPYFESTLLLVSYDADLDKIMLNKTLNELNSMCGAGDYNELSLLLNISVNEAKELRSFKLLSANKPAKTDYDYNKLLLDLKGEEDEKKREEMLFNIIDKPRNDIFNISITSYNSDVLPKLSEPLLKLFDSNPYFMRRREIQKEALDMEELRVTKELEKLDVLKIILTKAIETNETDIKRGSGNIFMGEPQLYNPLPVYDKFIGLYTSAIDIRKKIHGNEKTAEIMSGFVKITKNSRPNFVFVGFVSLGFGLVMGFVIAVCIQVIKYIRMIIHTKNL